jgi:hypothetical protein
MHCSLYGRVAHIADLLSRSAPSRLLDSSGVFFSAFFFPQSTPHSSKGSFAAQPAWHRQVSRYPTLHEAVVKSSLATNLSRRQALFVQGNYCSSVFWWAARHAFLPKKIEKIQYLPWHKVLCVVCGVCLIFCPCAKNLEGRGSWYQTTQSKYPTNPPVL